MLPVPAGLPTPQGMPLPAPDPNTFGLGPLDAQSSLSAFLPQQLQIQTPGIVAAGDDWLTRMTTALGGSGNADPAETLLGANQQTDRALARIAQVNPELAEQLSVQRGEEPDSPGFFGRILQTVASSPLGKALEIITRPGRIIPEILTDGDESIWKNVGDALSGHSDATMGDWLEQMNIMQGDDLLSKIGRGVTSFGLDVAVDPLTYMTAGLGSVGRIGATRFGSMTAAKAVMYGEGLSTLDNIASTLGKKALNLADDAPWDQVRAKAFEHWWKTITDPRMGRSGKWGALADDLSVVHQDFIGGPLGMALHGADKAVALHALKVADEAHKVIGKFGLNRLGPKMAEQFGIPIDEMTKILQAQKIVGKFGTRAEYMQGRYAASLLGGVRFSLPGIRIITPAIWGTAKMDMSIARRFMSGLSGQYRIMRAVERKTLDPFLARQALEAATTGGWNGLKQAVPQVAQHFGGPGGRLGTAFASASWQIGGITRNLGSFALVRGGGLGTALSADARKTVRSIKATLQREALELANDVDLDDPKPLEDLANSGLKLDAVGDVSKRGTGRMSVPETQRTLHQLDRLVREKYPDDPTIVIRALESFPDYRAQQMGAERWYSERTGIIQRNKLPDDVIEQMLKTNEIRLSHAKQVELLMKESPEIGLAARIYRLAAKQTVKIHNEFGGHTANSTIRAGAEPVIHPANRQVVETGHVLQHGKTYVQRATRREGVGPGFELEDVVDTPFGRGYDLEEIDEFAPPVQPEAPGTKGAPEGPEGPRGGPERPSPESPELPPIEIDIEGNSVRIDFEGYDNAASGRAGLDAEIDESGNIVIQGVGLPEELRGRGLGKKMYHRLADEAEKRGGVLMSDVTLSGDAQELWRSLAKRSPNLVEPPDFDKTFNWVMDASKPAAKDQGAKADAFLKNIEDETQKMLDGIELDDVRELDDITDAATQGEEAFAAIQKQLDLVAKKDPRYNMPDRMTGAQLREAYDPKVKYDGIEWRKSHGSKEEFAKKLTEEGQKRPIRLAYDPEDGQYFIFDGHHRVEALDPSVEYDVEWIPEPAWVDDAQGFINQVDAELTPLPRVSKALGVGDEIKKMHVGDFVERPDIEPSANIRTLVAGFGVPEEHLDLIDNFAQSEAVDPKWGQILGNKQIGELDEATDIAYWQEKLGSIDAWHRSRFEGDPDFDEFMKRSPEMDPGQKEDLATELFGDPLDGGWNKVLPSDYLEIMGPGALDAEMAAMDEFIGRSLGKIPESDPRFRDIVGKVFTQEESQYNSEGIDKLIKDLREDPQAREIINKGSNAYPRKQAVAALKNPVVINEDAAAMIKRGKRPVDTTTAGGMDIAEQADEYVAKTMEMFNEKWDPQIRAILDNPKFDEMDEQVQEMLKDLGLAPEGMTREMARIALESQDEIAARLKTQFLEEAGHDGVIHVKDGKQRVVVFEKGLQTGDRAPIWELTNDAPIYGPEQGYFHRRMTSEVHELLEGKPGTIERRAPRDWDAHFERQTKDMNFGEADNHIRKMLREMDLEVPDDMRMLDVDVPANLAAYVDGMANDVGNIYLGRQTRRLQQMGLSRSPFTSRFLGPRYEAAPSAAYMNSGKWLSQQSEKFWQLAQKMARHQTKVAKVAQKDMRRIETTLAGLNERIQSAIDREVNTVQWLQEHRGLPEDIASARKAAATPENLRPGLVKQLQGREAELDRLRQKADWQTNAMKEAAEEWNRIQFSAQARVADPKVALRIGDPEHVGMGKVMVPGLEDVYMPATMADEFNYAARGFKSLNEFQKVWRRYLSWWKEWATWAWPGFHIRNMMGGWFNNWLGGVQIEDYVEIGRAMRARREVETGAAKPKWSSTKLPREFINKHGLGDYYFGLDPTYADLAVLLTNNGINAGNSQTFGAARIGSELLDKEMAKPADSPWTIVDTAFRKNVKAGKPGRIIAKKLRGTGELTENMLRGAAFLQGLKQTDGDMMGAHTFTMMRHGDYGDLSDWEYGAIRDVVPFYKWMRTNTPLQIHTLFENPGKLMGVLHAKDAFYTATGIDQEDVRSKLPEWAQEGFSIPTLGSTEDAINLVAADLPMNDLYQGAGELFSSILPLARPFLESYVTEKSFFTGKPIEGAPVKVAWIDNIPFVGKLLSGIGIGQTGEDGGYYIDDKLQNTLGVIPIVGRFRDWLYEDPKRTKLRGSALISAASGVSFRTYGEAEFMSEELNFYYGTVLPTMDYLKQLGYPLPTTEDLNAMYGATNNVLAAAGIPAGGA